MPNTPSDFPDLSSLVRWIAKTYHGGAILPMSDRTGLSNACIDKWAKSRTKNPALASLAALADGYGMAHDFVVRIAMRRPPRRGRGLACLVAGLLGLSLTTSDMVPAEGGTLYMSDNKAEIPLTGSWLLLLWRAFVSVREHTHPYRKNPDRVSPTACGGFPGLRAAVAA